ncbi:hypothetical protein LTR48_003694 [Friedmanniomyces endolithicus]|uniref:Uncharacterized protein n=1 Tax=Rachicladosporium monterosium TaxID=1507873 RepID=A0ABR0L7H9_9PEZI|nr:hypothetical protein LTR48_003694 [Friedmanniomyces endolithicus]KAK5144717.1 hypothetical protein LTR32_003401 [Rachicladosporium monterosium]
MPPRKKNHSVATSAATSAASSTFPSRAPSPTPRQPFRLFDLPPELRLRIYEEALHVREPLDLAYRVFYAQPLRLFPTHGRFFHTKLPLLARLPSHYRAALTTLEIRLGPGWSAPPRSQKITPNLGLADCVGLRRVRVFVELDPSERFFDGFRGSGATEETYMWFCVGLLRGVFGEVPGLEVVEVDAFPAVKRDAPLVLGLRREIKRAGLRLVWGPLRGWGKEGEVEEVEEVIDVGASGLEKAMRELGVGGAIEVPRVVEVLA